MSKRYDASRRRFLAAGGAIATASAAAAAAGPALAQSAAAPAASPTLPPLVGRRTDALLARGKARRVVICGGGWGGVTAARYLRQSAPQLEVVLLERNPVFFSCPMSNKWLVNIMDADYLTKDYLKVSEEQGYRFIQTEILEIERDTKRVITAAGALDYDYLILSPGIRYNYEAWFGNDRRAAEATRARFPAAYIPSAEHFRLKQAIHDFKGGDLVMTLPPPPQRCPPSPYERACLIAALFKARKLNARVVILDHKDDVRPIGPGFKAAFQELYKDIITYVPNAHVKEVDPFNKRIKTAAGDFDFEHAILMAPHQAGDLAWKAGVVGKSPLGGLDGWANVDPLFLNDRNDPDVYVIGDAVGFVSPQFAFYPKAGHVANRHARIVARYIAEREAGRDPAHDLPNNLCYMMVSTDPQEAISVQFDYKINEQGVIEQTQWDFNQRKPETVSDDFEWARIIYGDMFG
ncbi:NAD(P)/FAD-dependent oxidoreductase [Pseudothauera nasutitermitis]|uniref:NAD(P)/FAD-dependent oxidoreductase n=1 Tax=Pseudothauera nasutitermitis TaxID=2565930 RepID=A0A4S4AX07_9RHOO|nr:FAD/NAD(P)-binding oxidoreductase [Pseudothauera nasutitermitis]THF64554.1 NAD(P)/FAD-dependent oxidoreductase [Pseudothauera nasutitermitis]